MTFGHFVTSIDDDTPAALDWDDMVYDGWPLANGNYLYSSHRYVREISPSGVILWNYQLPAPNELKTCQPLSNGDVAVALLNLHPNATRTITLDLSDVVCATCARRATVTDVWGSEGAPPVPVEGTVSMPVAPHETKLLRLALG